MEIEDLLANDVTVAETGDDETSEKTKLEYFGLEVGFGTADGEIKSSISGNSSCMDKLGFVAVVSNLGLSRFALSVRLEIDSGRSA